MKGACDKDCSEELQFTCRRMLPLPAVSSEVVVVLKSVTIEKVPSKLWVYIVAVVIVLSVMALVLVLYCHFSEKKNTILVRKLPTSTPISSPQKET